MRDSITGLQSRIDSLQAENSRYGEEKDALYAHPLFLFSFPFFLFSFFFFSFSIFIKIQKFSRSVLEIWSWSRQSWRTHAVSWTRVYGRTIDWKRTRFLCVWTLKICRKNWSGPMTISGKDGLLSQIENVGWLKLKIMHSCRKKQSGECGQNWTQDSRILLSLVSEIDSWTVFLDFYFPFASIEWNLEEEREWSSLDCIFWIFIFLLPR